MKMQKYVKNTENINKLKYAKNTDYRMKIVQKYIEDTE